MTRAPVAEGENLRGAEGIDDGASYNMGTPPGVLSVWQNCHLISADSRESVWNGVGLPDKT